jgi:hypothetical protein
MRAADAPLIAPYALTVMDARGVADSLPSNSVFPSDPKRLARLCEAPHFL